MPLQIADCRLRLARIDAIDARLKPKKLTWSCTTADALRQHSRNQGHQEALLFCALRSNALRFALIPNPEYLAMAPGKSASGYYVPRRTSARI